MRRALSEREAGFAYDLRDRIHQFHCFNESEARPCSWTSTLGP
jgi:hypothetical protein